MIHILDIYEIQDEIINDLTLMDDIMMKEVFKNKKCTELLIKIILNKDDIEIKELEIQSNNVNLKYKSIIMDILAVDSNDCIYNIEIQKENEGADPKRARYHSSMIDSHILKKGKLPQNLPNTYVIFITQRDALKKDKMIYHIERVIRETNDEFIDGSKIIYVNTSKIDETPLGKLMQDLREKDSEKLHYKELKQELKQAKTEYILKEDKKMNKLLEEYTKQLKETSMKEGREKGLLEGMERGLEKGMEKGMERGMEKGIKKGMEKGMERGKSQTAFEIAKNMLKENIDITVIEKITGLSKDKIIGL